MTNLGVSKKPREAGLFALCKEEESQSEF